MLEHFRYYHARQIRSACRHGKRQAEADQIVRGIADDGLVHVTDQNGDSIVRVGEGAEIAKMAVTANPDWRTLGDVSAIRFAEPLVKFRRIAANISLDRARHL